MPIVCLAHDRAVAAHVIDDAAIVYVRPLAGQPLEFRYFGREFWSIEKPRYEIRAKLRLEIAGIGFAGEVGLLPNWR